MQGDAIQILDRVIYEKILENPNLVVIDDEMCLRVYTLAQAKCTFKQAQAFCQLLQGPN